MRLIKDTDKKDVRRMRKEWGTGERECGTGEKECGNLLDKERKRGSRARGFIQNLPLLAVETT